MLCKIDRYLAIAVVVLLMAIANATLTWGSTDVVGFTDSLQQSQLLYNRGEFKAAVVILNKAIAQYQKQEDSQNLATAYNYLAINYIDLESWNEAEAAIVLSEQFARKINDKLLIAHVLNTKGILQGKTGKLEAAILNWQKTGEIYRELDAIEPFLQSQINQAQALRTLGYGLKARRILEESNRQLQEVENPRLKVKALQSLGIGLRSLGELAESQAALDRSSAIAEELNLANVNSIQLSLAATVKARGNLVQAREIYEQIRAKTSDRQTYVKVGVNLLEIALKTSNNNAIALLTETIEDLKNLPASLHKINLEIALAIHLIDAEKDFTQYVPQLLHSSLNGAKQLQNSQLESVARGELGRYYERQQQWQQAAKTTEKAIFLADISQANFLSFRWYWQQGRILKARGKNQEAIAYYRQAINTLQSLRQNLVASTLEIQFSFRDRVEPLYRQYVELLLEDIDSLPAKTQQQHLIASREAIESLQLAELENFFRESCIVSDKSAIEEIDPRAAVIYPIILENRLAVIFSLPNKPLQYYSTKLDRAARDKLLLELNLGLIKNTPPQAILTPARQLYDLLIRPVCEKLEEEGIQTIVFVLDEWLRDLPMSILHDGESYLIEKYNIALAPGLQLVASHPQSMATLKILTAGIAEARQGFSALPNVATEISKIDNLTETEVLIDRQFTRPNFAMQIETENFSAIHLATHGQFSSKLEDTFLMTWDEELNIKELARLLQNKESDRFPIELLVLSACETARGDKRASLGMAGMAVKSGARSTIASLWTISDRSTAELMTNFYRFLDGDLTKAAALRKAQLSLLNSSQYNHPYYWSPFVLIGDWQ